MKQRILTVDELVREVPVKAEDNPKLYREKEGSKSYYSNTVKVSRPCGPITSSF